MLVVMRDHASQDTIDHVVEILHEHGAEAHLSQGEVKTIIGVIGEREIIYTLDLEGLPGAQSKGAGSHVIEVSMQLKFMSVMVDDQAKALSDAGIPATAFITADIAAEVARLNARGVAFRGEPVPMGPITAVMFEDTCGNLIQLVQPHM